MIETGRVHDIDSKRCFTFYALHFCLVFTLLVNGDDSGRMGNERCAGRY